MSEYDIYEQLGRIEGKLDLIIPVITEHSRRLSTVEKKQSWILGVFSTVVIVWTSVMGLVKFN